MSDTAQTGVTPTASSAGGIVAIAAPFVFAIAAIFVFSPALAAPWIYDDYSAIVGNAHLRTLQPLTVPMSSESDEPLVDRPVVSLTLAINYALAGGTDNPFPFRMTNLAIHIANALLLLGLVRRTLQLHCMAEPWQKAARPIGFSVALLWLVHPLSTEPVIYVTQRTELLMATFLLLTLYSFLRASTSPSAVRRHTWSAVCVVACALGMASKEVMVGVPLIVLLFDRAYLSGGFAPALRRHTAVYIGLAATWALLAALVFTEPSRSQSAGLGLKIGVWDYLRIQAGMIVHYLSVVFYSGGLNISYHEQAPSAVLAWLPQGLFVFVLLLAALLLTKWRPMWGVPALTFFVVLAPSSSVIPIETEVGADRRMYVPAACMLSLLCLSGFTLLRRRFRVAAPQIVLILSLVAAGYFGAQSFARAGQWNDPVGIWDDSLTKSPGNPVAHNNYAFELFTRRNEDSDTAADAATTAIQHFKKAIAIEPNYASAHANLAGVYMQTGELELAMQHVRKALELDPSLVDAHNNFGVLLTITGNHQKALMEFDKAVALSPGDALAHFNRADALFHLGRNSEGIAAMQRALDLGLPAEKLPNAFMRLGDLQAADGDADLAMSNYERALEFKPRFPSVLFKMGMIRAGQNDIAGASRLLERAIEQDPDYTDAHFNLAMCLARMQQWSQAIVELETVLRLEPDFPGARAQLEYIRSQR